MVTHFHTGSPATGGQDSAHFTAALLQATLSANKVTAIVALAHDGPQLWAYTCALGLGEQPERVERLAGALAVAAGADSARVTRTGGRLLVEIPKPPHLRKPLQAARLDGLVSTAALAVPLGLTTGGQVAWFDLADERTCHLAIGGTTGSGKSVALHWLLYRILTQNHAGELRLLCFDPKRGELRAFQNVPHLLHPIISSPIETARVLAWIGAELDRRADSGQRAPALVVVVEEVADLITVNPDVAGLLARVAQIGRGLGVHLVVTTQQPGARSLGDALANFPARLLGRVASATLTFGAAGRARTMADSLLGRGDMLLLTAGDVVRLQVPMVDGATLARLPQAHQVASLAAELPSLAQFADRARDPRGGAGRRALTAADYEALDAALTEGASVDDLRAQFGIGWERARRMYGEYWGQNEP